MSGLFSDPILLLSPPKPPSEGRAGSGKGESFRKESRPFRGFYVAIPSLSHSEKNKYKSLPESTLTNDVGFEAEDLDQVIGEYREKDTLYYFVRFRDGMAHKVRVFVCGGL